MDKLPTPIEIIEKILLELSKLELREGEKEHLTEIASNLTDFHHAVKNRLEAESKPL
jgi:hypothetical protein